jgi:outer membrane assembly lipoprotein YfiO
LGLNNPPRALTSAGDFGIVSIAMRRLLWPCLLALLVLSAQPGTVHAAWVWSPETGWIGPSGAVKDSPEEQLAHAQGYFERRDYRRARTEFQKLVKRYKQSREAGEAQYYIGRCREESGDYYKAFQAYHKTIQMYPSTTRFEEILDRMYQIGNHFLSGKKHKAFGTAAVLPARGKSIEIFKAISEDGPFSKSGELAQYKLGLAHLALGEYEQAVEAFEQLIARYPNSALIDDARFQLTQASLKGVFKPGYDQHPTDQALEELATFVDEYPGSDLAPEALERLRVLQERRAQHDFLVGQFYERRKLYASAKVYYQDVVNRYPQTAWGPKAAGRLQMLDRKP